MILENEMIHGCPAPPVAARTRRQARQPSAAVEGKPCGLNRQKSGAPRAVGAEPPFAGEWDASIRLYKEIQESGETGSGCSRLRSRIEDETPISPHALAECACQEASLWLGQCFPREWVAELVERANVVYQHNPGFRRRLRAAGDAGIHRLMAFMRHWLFAILVSRRSDLAARLPSSYASGHDLPPCTSGTSLPASRREEPPSTAKSPPPIPSSTISSMPSTA
jgi:hypothetical protein